MVRGRRLFGALAGALIALLSTTMVSSAPIPKKDEGYRIIIGSPQKAKVIVQAFYPLRAGGEDHTWVMKFGRKLATAYPGKVCFIAYDYATPRGGEVWQRYDLVCGAFIINGKREVRVKGKSMSFLRSPTMLGWSLAQLQAAVRAELRRPSPKPKYLEAAPEPAEGSERTTVSILVPCGLAGPYGDIVRRFHKHHPQIRLSTQVNGIVPMLKQLQDGKVKTDIFLALGGRELKQPALGGKLIEGSLVPCATIPLAVIVPRANPNRIRKLQDLTSPGVKTILTYSYNLSGGQGAREALQSAKLWSKAQPRIFTPKKPDDCKQMLKQGKADAAIVYQTCLRETYIPDKPPIEEKDLLAAVTLSPDLYEPITVGAALVKGTKQPDAARIFARFLAGPEAKAVWKSWGFGAVK